MRKGIKSLGDLCSDFGANVKFVIGPSKKFNNQNNNTEKLTDPETTFEPLNTQLAKAQVNFDDYGDKLLRSL